MPKKRTQLEEIIEKLRHADVLLEQGKKIAKVVKALGVTDVTDSRWRRGVRRDEHDAGLASEGGRANCKRRRRCCGGRGVGADAYWKIGWTFS